LLVQRKKVTDSAGSAREEQREALVRRVSRERAAHQLFFTKVSNSPTRSVSERAETRQHCQRAREWSAACRLTCAVYWRERDTFPALFSSRACRPATVARRHTTRTHPQTCVSHTMCTQRKWWSLHRGGLCERVCGCVGTKRCGGSKRLLIQCVACVPHRAHTLVCS
jgi:hypothetical protein